MKKTEQKVIRFIEQQNLFVPGEKILIALSGGPDSVFGIYFLNKFKRKYKIEITAVHFNHHLRGRESDNDEFFCEQLCEEINVPFYCVHLDVKSFSKQEKISIEEAARKLRYSKLEEIQNDFEADKIVTAHNQSDNTETVLLNLLSGSGMTGLAGIPVKRGKIVRPFLCLTKDEIIQYLHDAGISFRNDSSNKENVYKRNLLRNKIIPQIQKGINPAVHEAVFRTSNNLRNASAAMDNYVKIVADKYINVKKDSIRIDTALFESNDNLVAGEILKNILRDKFSHDFIYDDYQKIKKLSSNQKGKSTRLSLNLTAIRESNHIKILNYSKEVNVNQVLKVGSEISVGKIKIGIEEVSPKDLSYDKSGKTEYVEADNLVDEFIVRNWRNGDSFYPFGMKGRKKLSDFITDIKVESSQRNKIFVLENRNKIVWVIGLRLDNRFKINNDTKKVYKLWMK